MTSEAYFLPSKAYNFSCLQNDDNSGFLSLKMFQYFLGSLESNKYIEVKLTENYNFL
jgi:hypothetical protein